MRCPFCNHEDTQVVDTRSNPEANVIRRRRRCPKCDKRFTQAAVDVQVGLEFFQSIFFDQNAYSSGRLSG